MVFIYIILSLINNKTKIILEYNETSLSIFIDLFKVLKLFYKEVYQKVIMENKLNKKLHIKIKNEKFTYFFDEKVNYINFKELNEF
jgi:hypothetical protein